MIYTFFEGYQRSHTADKGTMIARQATVANQTEGQLLCSDTIDYEFERPSA